MRSKSLVTEIIQNLLALSMTSKALVLAASNRAAANRTVDVDFFIWLEVVLF